MNIPSIIVYCLSCLFFRASFTLKILVCLQFWKILSFGHSMRKLLGQGSNPCHSRNPSCCSDTRSLTHCATREFLSYFLKYYLLLKFRCNWHMLFLKYLLLYHSFYSLPSEFLFIFFFFGHPLAYGVPDPSHSCNWHHSFRNIGSLTCCAGQGSNLCTKSSRNTANSIAPQREQFTINFR